MFDDGNDSEVRDENDQVLFTNKNGAKKQDTLEQFLGIKSGDGYSLLMHDAGFGDYLGKGKWSGEGSTISASAIQGLVEKGLVSKDFNNPVIAYNKQRVETYKKAYADDERKQWKKAHEDVFSRFTSDNPQVKELITQYDERLSSRPKIKDGGCVFRDIQAVCEIASGMSLTSDQIISIWDTSITNNYISSDGEVQASGFTGVAELTMQKLQMTGFGVDFGGNYHEGELIAYMGIMDYNDKETHKALYLQMNQGGDYDKKIPGVPFYNSGHTNNPVRKNGWREIYLYNKTRGVR